MTDGIIKIEATPEQITESLPEDFLADVPNAEQGFTDRELKVYSAVTQQSVTYSLSYDGEGELLGKIASKPDDWSDEDAEEVLVNYLNISGDEDEDEDEDDEVTAQEA